MKRYRVNLSLDNDTYDKAKQMSRRCGFRSVCALTSALLRLALNPPGAPELEEAEGDISGFFSEFSEWERDKGNRHAINRRD